MSNGSGGGGRVVAGEIKRGKDLVIDGKVDGTIELRQRLAALCDQSKSRRAGRGLVIARQRGCIAWKRIPLTHHAEILLLEGDSYRRREAELNQQERNRQRPRRRNAAK